MNNALSDFLSGLNDSETATEAGWRLVRFVESYGALGVHVWLDFETGGRGFKMGSVPDWWVPYLESSGAIEHDYMCQHCRTRVEPLTYGFDKDYGNPALHPVARRRAEVAYEGIGMRNVVMFPVHMPIAGPSGGVSFGTGSGKAAFGRFLAAHQSTLHVASMSTHLRMQALRAEEKARHIRLSGRERECLLWLAKGLRTARIAERLGIEEVTVGLYVGKAKKKLGVTTREQAVAKSILLGLISP